MKNTIFSDEIKRSKPIFTRLLALILVLLIPTVFADKKIEAMTGEVTGQVQKVGFRAHILKTAIAYNLAGMAENKPEGGVQFTLQGNPERLQQAVKIISEGTDKSANVKVSTQPAAITPLSTFTVHGWTSTTRNITKPYDLVFTLRMDNRKITKAQAKEEYNRILCQTLDAKDLQKLTHEEMALCD